MIWVVLAASAFAVAAFFTGTWRWLMRPFHINARTMTVERLGFHVTDENDRSLVHGVTDAFAGGFNAMISAPSRDEWIRFSDRQPVLLRPFADEGAAMGFALRCSGRFSPERFERGVVARRASYKYLHYVGLGFWSAMRDHHPARLQRVVERLDPLHGMLCWDGYGFKLGFFDFARESFWRTRLERLTGYARNAAYQGLGRSLWFRFMGRPRDLIETVQSLGPHARDAASGVGLAVAFTTVDRLQRGFAVLGQMPDNWHDDILLGMTFAYKARSISAPEYFESMMNTLESDQREAIGAAIERCDAIETVIRTDGGVDGYRRWRMGLRDWLGENIEYPFDTMKAAERTTTGFVPVST